MWVRTGALHGRMELEVVPQRRWQLLVTCSDTSPSGTHDRHGMSVMSLFPAKQRLNLRVSLNLLGCSQVSIVAGT